MKKFILPFSLLLAVLVFAGVPFVPSSYEASTNSEAATLGHQPLLPTKANSYEYASPMLPDYLEDHSDGRGDQYNPIDNPITNVGARLGRVLFYDTRLSINNKISCASCHVAKFGFSDSARFSQGLDGKTTHRHSMGLTNSRIQPIQKFFWDASADILRDQVAMAVTSEVEMGMTFSEVIERLKATDFYAGLFNDAFGGPHISKDRITAALGQFVRAMVAKNSKFDLAATEEGRFFPPLAAFSKKENDGYKIFVESNCVSCHSVPHFASHFPSNNGLDATNEKDKGLGGVTESVFDEGLFKAPPLRNIELTAPYMHDGRFKTLEEVVEHYNSGIQPNPALSPELMDNSGMPKRLNLSTYQKEALVDFLKTLTDTYFVDDPRFEDPFNITTVREEPLTPMDKILHRKRFGGNNLDMLKVDIFPNPMVDNLNIQLKNPSSAEVNIEIVDMNGRVVARQSGVEENFKVERNGLPSGTYVIMIRSQFHAWSQALIME